MALPSFFPFRTRHYQATTTTSNAIASVAVPARGELIKAYYATTPQQSQTAAANYVTVAVNGTSVTGWSSFTVTTSTGNSATDLGSPTAKSFVVAGDVVSVAASSCVGGTLTVVIREF